jgi:hypothetical protein
VSHGHDDTSKRHRTRGGLSSKSNSFKTPLRGTRAHLVTGDLDTGRDVLLRVPRDRKGPGNYKIQVCRIIEIKERSTPTTATEKEKEKEERSDSDPCIESNEGTASPINLTLPRNNAE